MAGPKGLVRAVLEMAIQVVPPNLDVVGAGVVMIVDSRVDVVVCVG